VSDAVETIKAIAEKHNLNAMDINAEVHAERPLLAEEDLSISVIQLAKAGNFTGAAAAIELAVRRAYEVEGAA
jgi:hypothetical protein